MNTNQLYEVLILGATPEGLALAELLGAAGRKTALISSNFIYRTKKHCLDAVDLYEQTGIFLAYNHGIFSLTLSDKTTVHGQSFVIATGTKPNKSSLKNHNILYTSAKITTKQKERQAVVFGSDTSAVDYALDLAKKFRYVYLCSNTFELACDKRHLIKLNNQKNIVHLPGCNIVSCRNDKEGKIAEVYLDTYDTIRASALVMSLGRTPSVPAFLKRFINIDSDGSVAVTLNNESTKVPGVYALGAVIKQPNKKDISKVVNILNIKFGGL